MGKNMPLREYFTCCDDLPHHPIYTPRMKLEWTQMSVIAGWTLFF